MKRDGGKEVLGGLFMLTKSLGQRGLWAVWSLCTIKVTAAHSSVCISAVIRVSCLAFLTTSNAQRLCILLDGSFVNANEAHFLSLKITFKRPTYVFKPKHRIQDRQQTQNFLVLLLQSCFSAEKLVSILKPTDCQRCHFVRKNGCDGKATEQTHC